MGLIYNTNCCICGYELKHFSRSADPVKEGRCCLKCFKSEVVPARKKKIQEWAIEEAQKKIDYDAMKEQSECPTGKICYKTKVDAEYALYTSQASKMNGCNGRKEKLVYCCKLCGQFHLTSHDQLPSWRDRNKPTNYNYSRPAKYIPVARQENWENDAGV